MAKESERSQRMKKEFMMLHEQGLSIPEIAERFKLSADTVYRKLQEIAEANNVTRESLLQVVREPTERQYALEEQKTKVTVEELRRGFAEAGEKIDFLMKMLDDMINEEDE